MAKKTPTKKKSPAPAPDVVEEAAVPEGVPEDIAAMVAQDAPAPAPEESEAVAPSLSDDEQRMLLHFRQHPLGTHILSAVAAQGMDRTAGVTLVNHLINRGFVRKHAGKTTILYSLSPVGAEALGANQL